MYREWDDGSCSGTELYKCKCSEQDCKSICEGRPSYILVQWLSSRGASLSEQHTDFTDLLICHCTNQDLSRTSRYLGITCDKPTARTAAVSVSTYAQTKLYTKVISCIYADGPHLKWPQPLSWSNCTACGQPAVDRKLPCVLQVTNAAL